MSTTAYIEAPAPPKLYPKQKAAICDSARIVCIDASTKSGKTAGCLAWAYANRINKPGTNGLWVEPNYRMARDIGYVRLCKMLRASDPGMRIWEPFDSRLEVRFINGSVERFKGGDEPDGIYGEDYADAVIDEASRCKEGVWEAVRSTLTATRGHVRIIGNVKGRKNWAFRLGQMAKGGQKDMAYHKLTAFDAVDGGIMAAEEVEDAKAQLSEAAFRELYLAEPTEDGANPFGIAAIARCVKPLSREPAECFGIDLAKSTDWTWVIGLDAFGNVCVSERWQSPWTETMERIERIIGKTFARIDSTGVGDPIVETLQRRGCNVDGVKFTNESKQQLMEGLAVAIQRGDTSVVDGLHRDELEAFEFAYKNRRVVYSAPEGMHDDGVCAHALAVSAKVEGRKSRIIFREIDL